MYCSSVVYGRVYPGRKGGCIPTMVHREAYHPGYIRRYIHPGRLLPRVYRGIHTQGGYLPGYIERYIHPGRLEREV